jgi:hypothetical protein
MLGKRFESVTPAMQAEVAIGRGDRGNGVLVQEEITTTVNQDAETVERLDVTLQFVAGHHEDGDVHAFLAGLVEILVLNVERGFSHDAAPLVMNMKLVN